MVSLSEFFMAFTIISVFFWERRGTVEEEAKETEPKYSVQKSATEEDFKNSSVEF